MKNLTYKDLKALYQPKVYFQRKAIANFFYLTLCEALPILSDDIEWLTTSTDKNTLRLKHFIEISFASTFNHISLVQNKATISKLLYNALNENQIENFKKIAVDTSVFDLEEVQEFINTQPREIKAKIHKYYSDSIDIPIISNNKNKVSQKPMFIIGLLDSMDIINGQISFYQTRLLKLATLTGMTYGILGQPGMPNEERL